MTLLTKFQFLNIIFLEIREQQLQLARLANLSPPGSTLKSSHFFGEKGAKNKQMDKSGTAQSLRSLALYQNLQPAIFGVRDANALLEVATRRTVAKYGLPVGSPYLFGKMVGLFLR